MHNCHKPAWRTGVAESERSGTGVERGSRLQTRDQKVTQSRDEAFPRYHALRPSKMFAAPVTGTG
jgi:hypothetical protein